MKKFVALLLTLVLTFSLAACGAEGGVKDDEAAGPGSFKIGTLDTGSADATTAPLLNQLKRSRRRSIRAWRERNGKFLLKNLHFGKSDVFSLSTPNSRS